MTRHELGELRSCWRGSEEVEEEEVEEEEVMEVVEVVPE